MFVSHSSWNDVVIADVGITRGVGELERVSSPRKMLLSWITSLTAAKRIY